MNDGISTAKNIVFDRSMFYLNLLGISDLLPPTYHRLRSFVAVFCNLLESSHPLCIAQPHLVNLLGVRGRFIWHRVALNFDSSRSATTLILILLLCLCVIPRHCMVPFLQSSDAAEARYAVLVVMRLLLVEPLSVLRLGIGMLVHFSRARGASSFNQLGNAFELMCSLKLVLPWAHL